VSPSDKRANFNLALIRIKQKKFKEAQILIEQFGKLTLLFGKLDLHSEN
jgi:Flp pilus assembly protein TadD